MISTIRSDGATVAPEAPPRAPREPQDGPRSPQDGSRWPQDGPKTAPDGPKTAQDGPNGHPGRVQDGPQMVPRTPPEDPRAPKTPLASHLGLRAPKFAPDGPKISPEWLPYRPQRLQNDVQVFPSLFHTCCKRVPPFRSDAVRGTLFVPCGAAEKGDIAIFLFAITTRSEQICGVHFLLRESRFGRWSASPPQALRHKKHAKTIGLSAFVQSCAPWTIHYGLTKEAGGGGDSP